MSEPPYREMLLIGGSQDGERIIVHGTPRPEIIFGNPPILTLAGADQSLESLMEPIPQETYRRETFSGHTQDFYVYVLASMTPDDVVAALIHGYKRPDRLHKKLTPGRDCR